MGKKRNKKKGAAPKKSPSSTSGRLSLDDADYISGRLDSSLDRDAPLAFDIGTRVECLRLEGYDPKDGRGGGPHTGTVAGHWMRRDHWPEHFRAPYLVLLDDGMAVYCHRTDSDFVRESDVPPMEVTHRIGARVECKLEADGTRWFPGTVLQSHEGWHRSPIDTPPYFIRFDYGRERPFWGPRDRIRATGVAYKRGADVPLRFNVGDRVDCSVDDEWIPGTVVKCRYREDDFENGHAVPYQVRLDDGDLVFAPIDDEHCIRRSSTPEMPLRFRGGDRVECRMDGGWVPGTVLRARYWEDGFFRPYQIRVDAGDVVYAPMDDDSCVRRASPETPLRFGLGDRVDCMLEGRWVTGTVLKTWYRRWEEEDDENDDDDDDNDDDDYDDDDYEGGCDVVPYFVQLDNGDLVSAPQDDDSCIKGSTVPPIPLRFREGDRVACLVDEGWMPGTVSQVRHQDDDYCDGRVVPYQVKLDMGDIVHAPVDNDSFIKCVEQPSKESGKQPSKRDEEPSKRDDEPSERDDEGPTNASPICKGQQNGYVHVMSKMLIYNEKFDEATKMLEEQISWITQKLEAKPRDKDASQLRIDVSNLLLYLAEVHQATGSLDEMKDALDVALSLIEMSQDRSRNFRLMNLTAKLATHAALTNDKYSALEYLEEAIILTRETLGEYDSFRLGLMLLQCGKLNLGCNNMDRGVAQMTEGIDMLTRMYGSDNENVRMAREDLRAIRKSRESKLGHTASLFDPPCASEVVGPIGAKEGRKRWIKRGQRTMEHSNT
jgi:hypothetical protein